MQNRDTSVSSYTRGMNSRASVRGSPSGMMFTDPGEEREDHAVWGDLLASWLL